MITHPLTPQEQKTLRELKKTITNLNTTNDRLSICNDENKELFSADSLQDKETWLNILKMAERANELMEDKWRKSGRYGDDRL